MYPSDYGLSAIDTNWDKKYYDETSENFYQANINTTSWIYSTMSDAKNASWMLSPSSFVFYIASQLSHAGNVNAHPVYSVASGVRPVLSLSSSTTWLDGDGTKSNPYKIIAD